MKHSFNCKGLYLCIGLLILVLIFSSCSFFGTTDNARAPFSYSLYEKQDFIDQLNDLGKMYENTSGVKIVRLSKASAKYITSLFNKIKTNNELLFKQDLTAYVEIVKNNYPFYFSLPEGKIIISTGLVKKYIKNEEFLVSILVFEMIRIAHVMYRKNIIVPVGYITTERMISLTRISLVDKMEINKWAYYALNRAGFDPEQYLSWIQIQNKNTLDFLLHLGDTKSISREESLLKAFIVKQRKIEQYKRSKNSSNSFYSFINEVGVI